MRRVVLSTILLAASTFAQPALTDDRDDNSREGKVTVAVFGDWPYSQFLLDNANLLTNSVNADPDVSLVIHVGDIHSGSQPCTSAGILPVLPGAIPGWNQSVYFWFQQFEVPMVYTPGDNEWTDCHKTKQLRSGDPLKELAAVRSLFFARPGKTLGLDDRNVMTQAKHFDPKFPADKQYVENVMWEDAKTVFVTVNMPGSNNDTLPWTPDFENPTVRNAEVASRTAADIRWLQAAFKRAMSRQAKAVVVALQADMWDPAALVTGGDGLNAYTTFVQELAKLSLAFGKPVLLLNGDTHLFFTDKPLADPTSSTGRVHGTPSVPNLTRIVVQGSTNAPSEWLRLTIDTRTPNVFSWSNVVYCLGPNLAVPKC